jgi:hypothetical protein
MATGVAVADWIKRIADDERRRDAVRVKAEELAARKADLVRLNGRRLLRIAFAGRVRRYHQLNGLMLAPTESAIWSLEMMPTTSEGRARLRSLTTIATTASRCVSR